MLFPEMQSTLIRCKDCQYCNPTDIGSICALKPTNDKRYVKGYVKVYPLKKHYCKDFLHT